MFYNELTQYLGDHAVYVNIDFFFFNTPTDRAAFAKCAN